MIGRIGQQQSILGDREAELRAAEQTLLERLLAALGQFGSDVAAGDLQRLREAIEQLSELFLIVIAGEFNSGKSSFINALLGERVLAEGVTPTTDRINILRWGEQPGQELIEDFLLLRTYPAPLLGELNIVDTPGTNAIIRRHEELTREFVPRSDLVLFVTSADRPFTESEREFLSHIREWGKKIVFIINKVDILSSADVDEVTRFVRTNGTMLLGVEPTILPVSARQALKAREADDQPLWQQSGFSAVEDYLLRTLDEEQRVRLKLLNPLGVALKIASTYRSTADERLSTLTDDVKAIENIDSQLKAYRDEMNRDFAPRLSRIELLLNETEQRGYEFFDEHVRLGRMRDLIKPSQIQEQFQREVIGNLDHEIDREVQGIIDWLIERNLRLWQEVNAYLDRRQISRHRDQLVGEVGQNFTYNRQALLTSVGTSTQQIVSTYNREAEAAQLSSDIRGTLATTAITEVGAVGLGALLVTILSAGIADLTGILLATGIAVGGFYIIPAKRRQVKREFHAKMSELRDQLARSLNRQVSAEINEAITRVTDTIAPYTRFVRLQHEQLSSARTELAAVESSLKRLRTEISGESA